LFVFEAEPEVADATPSVEPDPAERAEAADFRRKLLGALGRLEEPYRSVLILREIQDLKYQEISEALNLPLNTVRVYIHRGRQRLREQLSEVYGYVPAT
ncbi:MAG TPA: sigma-70 family RNA polymerase sigma factor, partial [Thermoanaerobaculia bacterium]|nr:sigma-70 family RNA polymerase sigma factor [Thermoanaerobaculia bacterium]